MEEKQTSHISHIVLKEISNNLDEIKSHKKFKQMMKRNNSLDQLPTIKIKRDQFYQLSSRKWIKNDILTGKKQISKQKKLMKKGKKSIFTNQSFIESIISKHKNKELKIVEQKQKLKKKNELFALLLNKKKSLDRMKLNVIIRQALNDLIQRRQKLLNPLQQNQLIYSINF